MTLLDIRILAGFVLLLVLPATFVLGMYAAAGWLGTAIGNFLRRRK